MTAVYFILLFIILFFVITNLPVFGRLPHGLRLDKIRHLPNYRDGALQNLSATPMQPEGISFFKVLKAFLFENHPNKIPDRILKYVQPDLNSKPTSSAPEIIWFGHSSYFIKLNHLRILVDPVFSKAPSPFSFIGSKAFPGTEFAKAEHFKNLDVILITHDHYDHLDYQSILQLAPETKEIVTSVGVGSHLEKWGIATSKIKELCWDETTKLTNGMSLTAVPARHFTGRKFKRNQTLWSAFVLQLDSWKLFIGGDSGYDTHFKQIGSDYGPFDIVFLECGQYNAYWPYIHMFPEQTVQAAIDLNAKVLMPVHWGKFSLAMHPWDEPIKRLVDAAIEKQIQLATPKLGETVRLNEPLPVAQWWTEQ